MSGAHDGGDPVEDQPEAAVVLTKVAVPEAVAASCAMSGVPVDAVPTPIGVMAVARSMGLGDPEAVAIVLSQLVRTEPTLLLVQRGGQMRASRWEGGREQEEMSPALLLDGAPPEVEAVLLGQVRAADLPGVVTSVGMSRWRAMRVMAGMARAGRRGRKG